jgi:hypothetical protein
MGLDSGGFPNHSVLIQHAGWEGGQHGWGDRIKAKVPHGCWQTMTFLAAFRNDRITAPWLIDEPINGETFQLYVS